MKKIKKYLKVIYILWLRQIKRYYRSRPRMLGSLAQPVLFLMALGFGFGPIYQKAGGGTIWISQRNFSSAGSALGNNARQNFWGSDCGNPAGNNSLLYFASHRI